MAGRTVVAAKSGSGPVLRCGAHLLDLSRPRVMGILNVTPDSFSDGGDRADPEVAVRDGLAMLAAGADILDVGGESTRPGAQPVSLDDERARVLPVVKALAKAGAVVSVDTRHAAIMREAVAAGAAIINDVTALAGDPQSLAVAADCGVPVILMHMQGEPQTMQAIAVTLQRKEAPPELAQRLKHEVVRLRTHTLFVQDASVEFRIALLLLMELCHAIIVVMNECMA